MGHFEEQYVGYKTITYFIGDNGIKFKPYVRDTTGDYSNIHYQPLTVAQLDELAKGNEITIKTKEKVGYIELVLHLEDLEYQGTKYKGIVIVRGTRYQSKPRQDITGKKALKLFPEIANIPIFKQAISLEESDYRVKFVYCKEDNLLDFIADIPCSGRFRYPYSSCYFRVRGSQVTIHLTEKLRSNGHDFFIGEMIFNDKTINDSIEDIIFEVKTLYEKYNKDNIMQSFNDFNFMDALDYVCSENGCKPSIDALLKQVTIEVEKGSIEEWLINQSYYVEFIPKNYYVEKLWTNRWGETENLKLADYKFGFSLPREYRDLTKYPSVLLPYIKYMLRELHLDGIAIKEGET